MFVQNHGAPKDPFFIWRLGWSMKKLDEEIMDQFQLPSGEPR
jgi:hypothetical protein